MISLPLSTTVKTVTDLREGDSETKKVQGIAVEAT